MLGFMAWSVPMAFPTFTVEDAVAETDQDTVAMTSVSWAIFSVTLERVESHPNR